MAQFIALLQEVWIVKGKAVGLSSGHKIIMAACTDAEPSRAAIYHHADTRVTPHPAFTGRDVVSGLWDIGMPNLP